MTEPHDLAERETACADGMCPLCLSAELDRLRALLREADGAIRDLVDRYEASAQAYLDLSLRIDAALANLER